MKTTLSRLNIFAKHFLLDNLQGSEYASGSYGDFKYSGDEFPDYSGAWTHNNVLFKQRFNN